MSVGPTSVAPKAVERRTQRSVLRPFLERQLGEFFRWFARVSPVSELTPTSWRGRDLARVHPRRPRGECVLPAGVRIVNAVHALAVVSPQTHPLEVPLPLLQARERIPALQRSRVSLPPAFPLPYPGSRTTLCDSDAYLIAFWVASFWFLREATMRWFWSPLARLCGVKEGKAVVRFAEQGWSMLYCQSLLSFVFRQVMC